MFSFKSWIRNLGRSSPRRRPTPRKQPRTAKLEVEHMEDRVVPSHFRFGTLSWEPTIGNTVQFRGDQAWRASAFGNPSVGNTVSNGDQLFFGDGSSETIWLKVSSVNTNNDSFVASVVRQNGTAIDHAYRSSGTYTAFFTGCCRISTLQNGRDGNYRNEVIVTPGTGNFPPISSLAPIVQVPDNGIFSLPIPAVDQNSDTIRYRLATTSESQVLQPTGLQVSSTGVLTWDVRDTVLPSVGQGQLWTAQVMMEDLSPTGAVKSKVPLDFILQIVAPAAQNAAPIVSFNPAGPLSPVAGQQIQFTVTATDPDVSPINDQITSLVALNAPAGMVITPNQSFPGDPVSLTATWTPNQQQANQSFVVTFQATDSRGLTGNNSITISPAANRPPVANAGGPYEVDEGSSITLSGTGSDPEGTAVAYAWDLNYDGITFTPDMTGPTAIFDASQLDGPLTRTVALSVTDGFGLQTISTATVTVKNVAPQNVSILGPSQGDEGTGATFAASFTDPGVADTHSFDWHILLNNTTVAHGHDPSISLSPADDGIYTVILDVMDDDLGITNTQRTFTVRNIAPTATLSNNGPVVYGNAATVSFSGQSDPSPADTAAGFTYAYSLDGATFSAGGSSAQFSLNAGTHTVFGRIFDKDGDFRQYSTSVTVNKADAVVAVAPVSATYDGTAHGTTGVVTGVGGVVIGNPTISYSSGSAPVNAGSYTATGSFAGDANYNPASGTAAIAIAQRAIGVTADAKTKSYGQADPALTYHVTTGSLVAGDAFTGSLIRSAGENAGTYSIQVGSLTAGPNYTVAFTGAVFTIAKANATINVAGYTGVYDGAAHGAAGTAKGVNGETLAGLNLGASFTNVPGGTAGWIFTDVTGNYNDATGSVPIVITPATPVVSVTGGSFVYDGLAHPASGSVTGVGGANLGMPAFTYSYVDNDNNVVVLGGPPVEPGIYKVTASYAGSLNYTAASAQGEIIIAYEAHSLTDLSKAFKAGRTIPIKLQLTDANGNNLSSSEIDLTAIRLERVNSDGTRTIVTLADAGNANPENLFRYDADLQGYIFNLSTKGLVAGTYDFYWMAEGDPTEHKLGFTLI